MDRPSLERENDTRPAATGIAGLDHVLNGGLPRNRIYLISGASGAGKTTLALQFLLEGARVGETGIYVTLSETREELTAAAATHGWSLDALTVCELPGPDDRTRPETQYTLFHPSEVELSETTTLVLHEVERLRPTRVVFDSLSEMQLLARDPLRFRRQILALKQFFIGRQCTVLLLDDGQEPNHVRVDSLVNGVIALEQLAPSYGAEGRRLRVVKLRGARYRGGYHDFSIRTGGIVVHPRLVAADHRQSPTSGPMPSGVMELDSLLGGGLDAGTSTLITGPAGAGKSLLAARFAFSALERGEGAAIFVFDESRQTFLTRSAGVGMPFTGPLAARLHLQQIDPAELLPGEFVDLVRHAVNEKAARVVVIDSLNGYLNAMPNETFLAAQLHELLMYLNHRGVATLLVAAQHGLLGPMQAPVDVSYLADTVLLLRYFEAAGEVRQALSVVKKRTGDHERTIREFGVGSHGVRVGAVLREFEGVLTGVPRYTGREEPLLRREGDVRG